jgi:hypothetical protein
MRHCTIVALLVCLAGSTVLANGPFHRFSPDLGRLDNSVSVDGGGCDRQDVAGQDRELGWLDLGARGFFVAHQSDSVEYSLQPRLGYRKLEGSALLVDRDQWLPQELYDVSIGATSRYRLDNNWILGARIEVGSPSDEPFASEKELALHATVFVQMPWQESLDWVFLLDYANDRNFGRHVPLPGAALHYYPDRSLDVLVGFPYSNARWMPVPEVTLSASYLIPRSVNAEVAYKLTDNWTVYGLYAWDHQSWFRHDRHDDADQLQYYEMRTELGLRWDLLDGLGVEFAGGYAFDRFWFEGDEWDDRGRNDIDLEDACYVRLAFTYRF